MTTREFSIERVLVALQHEVEDAYLEELRNRAESLVAIAEHFQVPVDPVLLRWCHYRAPGKQWSGEEWTRYCAKYDETRRALEHQGALEAEGELWMPARCGHCGEPILTPAQAAAHVCRLLCPLCLSHEVEQVHGHWLCAHCATVVSAPLRLA